MRIPKLLISSSFILLGFLMLSSCDKKNALLVNRRTATLERIEEIKKAEQEKAETQRPKAIAAASPFIKKLYAEGRPYDEIRGFMQLENEREYLSSPLGEIVYWPCHFVYRVDGKNYGGAQTTNSCGIWAVRRKLRHMHHLGTYGIREDDWYRYSDKEMRQIIADISGDGHAETGKMLEIEDVVCLQIKFGIDKDNAMVRAFNLRDFYIDEKGVRHNFAEYKEVLCVNARENDKYNSRQIYCQSGRICEFDYDAYRCTGGCVRYYKLSNPVRDFSQLISLDALEELNCNIRNLPHSTTTSSIETILQASCKALTLAAKVIKHPDLAASKDFDDANKISGNIGAAPPADAAPAVTALYNAAKAVILYVNNIVAEVVNISLPNERQAEAAIFVTSADVNTTNSIANQTEYCYGKAVTAAEKAHNAAAFTPPSSASSDAALAAAAAVAARDAAEAADVACTARVSAFSFYSDNAAKDDINFALNNATTTAFDDNDVVLKVKDEERSAEPYSNAIFSDNNNSDASIAESFYTAAEKAKNSDNLLSTKYYRAAAKFYARAAAIDAKATKNIAEAAKYAKVTSRLAGKLDELKCFVNYWVTSQKSLKH